MQENVNLRHQLAGATGPLFIGATMADAHLRPGRQGSNVTEDIYGIGEDLIRRGLFPERGDKRSGVFDLASHRDDETTIPLLHGGEAVPIPLKDKIQSSMGSVVEALGYATRFQLGGNIGNCRATYRSMSNGDCAPVSTLWTSTGELTDHLLEGEGLRGNSNVIQCQGYGDRLGVHIPVPSQRRTLCLSSPPTSPHPAVNHMLHTLSEHRIVAVQDPFGTDVLQLTNDGREKSIRLLSNSSLRYITQSAQAAYEWSQSGGLPRTMAMNVKEFTTAMVAILGRANEEQEIPTLRNPFSSQGLEHDEQVLGDAQKIASLYWKHVVRQGAASLLPNHDPRGGTAVLNITNGIEGGWTIGIVRAPNGREYRLCLVFTSTLDSSYTSHLLALAGTHKEMSANTQNDVGCGDASSVPLIADPCWGGELMHEWAKLDSQSQHMTRSPDQMSIARLVNVAMLSRLCGQMSLHTEQTNLGFITSSQWQSILQIGAQWALRATTDLRNCHGHAKTTLVPEPRIRVLCYTFDPE